MSGFGRWFLHEIGASPLVDRFEVEFGERVTRWLLALIGVTVPVACGQAVALIAWKIST